MAPLEDIIYLQARTTLVDYLFSYLDRIIKERNAGNIPRENIFLEYDLTRLWSQLTSDWILLAVQCRLAEIGPITAKYVCWQGPMHELQAQWGEYMAIAERRHAYACGHWRFTGLGKEDLAFFLGQAAASCETAFSIVETKEPLAGVLGREDK